MSSQLLREVQIDELGTRLSTEGFPVVFMVAPNFEDRSVKAAKWMRELIDGKRENVAVQILWLQTPGVDDIFDRIKAENRDSLDRLFRFLGPRLSISRLDLPASDASRVLHQIQDLATAVGGGATLVLDISSLPRTIVRHLLDGLVRDRRAKSFARLFCLYTAAESYPAGADADMIGGVEGYFTKRGVHELVARAGVLDAVVSLAGTAHDAAQTLDALWGGGGRVQSTISATVLLNRNNFVYSYQRLAHATWALNRATAHNTELVYAFDLADAIRDIFERTDLALARHRKYREEEGEGLPTFLLGGFGPKPIGLAALLARMRYQHGMDLLDHPATSDVLQVTGWQYTTRYSHGARRIQAFEVGVDDVYATDYPE